MVGNTLIFIVIVIIEALQLHWWKHQMEPDLVAIYLRIGQVVVTIGQKIQMYFNFSLTISKNINRRDKVDKIIYLV